MRYLTGFSASLLLMLTVAAEEAIPDPPMFKAVRWDKAPAYYPGAPYKLRPESTRQQECTVKHAPDGGDDTQNILDAFDKCKENAKITFDRDTYNINKVMKITGLQNVQIDIQGRLLWSKDTDYWLKNSLPIPGNFPWQVTAFILGGDRVHITSSTGLGELNGNGEVWYGFLGLQDNAKGRPFQMVFHGLTNSVVEGIRYINSQMWTMAIVNSHDVLFQDIYVNSTRSDGAHPQNTDGADTYNSNNIAFARWIIDNGDDALSCKSNSTNILFEDIISYNGNGLAMGSVGQYWEQHDLIYNVFARNIWSYNSWHAAYFKTWNGVRDTGTSANDGGGGLGFMWNLTFTDVHAYNVSQPVQIDQCYQKKDCDTSKYWILDIKVDGLSGTIKDAPNANIATLACSGAQHCTGIEMVNLGFKNQKTGDMIVDISCDPNKVEDRHGFECKS